MYTLFVRVDMTDTKLNKMTRLSEKTQNRLKKYGRYGDTYDDIINRLMESYQISLKNLKPEKFMERMMPGIPWPKEG